MAPDYLAILRRNLTAALKRKDFAEAEQLLARLQQEAPLELQTRALQLELLVRQDEDPGPARRLARQLLELHPASARIQLWSGRAAYRAQEYRLAEQCFREAQRLAPHWLSECWLGKTLSQLGQLDEAEALLTGLCAQHPGCLLDLAWVHERREEFPRALGCIDAFLQEKPDDAFARRQRQRLLARTMDAEELIGEVEELSELGEELADTLLPEYIGRLLRCGQGDKARRVTKEKLCVLTPRIARDLAWTAYKLQAWDIAYEAFCAVLPTRLHDPKLLKALEKAARCCQRTEELAGRYRQLAPKAKKLHGRSKLLEQGGHDRTRAGPD